MKIAKNKNELFLMIDLELRKSLTILAEDIKNRWQDLLWENFYQKHSESEYYKRTYEILNSIVYTKPVPYKNGYMIKIYADMGVLNLAINGNFIQHKQADFPLYQLIEEGYHIFGNGWVDGSFAFKELLEELERGDFFRNELQKTFNIKIM